MNKYLLEIGVEELPSRFVEGALRQLKSGTEKVLNEKSISYEDVEVYATPRRFVLFINNVEGSQPDVHLEVKGPAKRIAFDEDNNPTKALQGFMNSQKINQDDIKIQELKGEEYVYAVVNKKGELLENILLNEVPGIIKAINFPKNMKWGGKNLKFARPIRWLLSILNDKVIPINLEGIVASNITRGHRFLGSDNIIVGHVDEYEELLKDNYVILNQKNRAETIKYGSKKLANSFGGELIEDEDLLEELTYIVEYPTPIIGQIKEEYLDLPKEVIRTPMREHLRYIPIYDKKENLMPYFITVRNGDDQYSDIVVAGNERVLDARLEDAKFFYNEDLKQSLEDRVSQLSGIIFQETLGTMYEKTERVMALAKRIGEYLELADQSLESLNRAAYLSKADLLTNIVQEFTELQGDMGAIYASKSGESEIVCAAIKEQYLPRFSGDILPKSTIGSILSIADKLDSIVGLFAIDLIPTGSQDPFALRRMAIGIINILNHNNWDISLEELIDYSLYIYVEEKGLAFDYNNVKKNILDFFYGRIKNMLDNKGINYDVIDAVLANKDDNILKIFTKAEGVNKWFSDHDHTEFVDAFTRIENILAGAQASDSINKELFEPEELQLYNAYEEMVPVYEKNIDQRKYYQALDLLAELVEPISLYFENIMVNVEEENIRNNRIAMLSKISNSVKDILNIKAIVE